MIRDYQGKSPVIHESAFLAETCAVIGDVVLKEKVNVWYGAVLRGDEGPIEVGEGSNIQDNATVHTDHTCKVVIGKEVTVGHNAVIHGCCIGDGTIVGMGAVVLNGAQIGKGCMIAAGALVKENSIIPDGSLCVGIPAKIVREMDEKAREGLAENARMYVRLGEEYKK